MNREFFRGLIDNAAFLSVMVLVFSFVSSKLNRDKHIVWKIFVGVILGMIGLAVMSTNWELLPGVIFDTRSVLLGITGLFFGFVPTLIAMFMTIGYRIFQGGSGAWMGVPVIIESCLIGLIWRAVRYKKLHQLSWLELYIFGLLIHIVMLLCTYFLPAEIRTSILNSIWFPVMTIYPAATLLLGVLMSNRLKRDILADDLIESEEKFAKVFNDSPQMITISSQDKGIFLDVNDSLTEILGYKKEEVVGRSVYDVNIWVNTADRKKILNDLEKGGSVRNREIRFRKKNGEIITCLGSATTIEIGGKIYLLLLGVSIEDRKRAERELAITNMNLLTEKHKLEAILRDMGDAVFVTDSNKKIILANKAMELLFGLTEKEMLGSEIDEVLILAYETSGKKPDDLIKNVFEKKKLVRPAEILVIKNKKGASVSVDGVASPIIDENLNLIGTVWLLRDVTKQRELEKMREDFVSLASHQLRTPLTGIKWVAELLSENASNMPIDKIQGYIKKIGDSNNRMIDLVGNLLSTSRIDSGRMPKKIESNPIRDLLQQAIDEQGKIFKEKKIKIEGMSDISKDLKIDADEIQMVQVFGNILSNAACYSPVGSTVEIGSKLSSGTMKIFVKDQGIGIPVNEQKNVFSKFFRADNVAKTVPGSGLGLYVAKTMVENHGGRIWFESKENSGTTFFVELPIKQKNG